MADAILSYPYYDVRRADGTEESVICRKGRWWRIKDKKQKLPGTDALDVRTPDEGGRNLEPVSDEGFHTFLKEALGLCPDENADAPVEPVGGILAGVVLIGIGGAIILVSTGGLVIPIAVAVMAVGALVMGWDIYRWRREWEAYKRRGRAGHKAN